MAKRDFYEVLGVERDADSGVLKKAYRGLAKRFHPDANSGDSSTEQKFKEISEAYDILKDDDKRAAYDRFGHAAFDGTAGAARQGQSDFGSGFADIFDEMFGDVMGGRGQRQSTGRARGADLRFNMEIGLEQAFKGHESRIKVPTSVTCEECKGSGASHGSHPVSCTPCQGRGKVRSQQGFFTIERTCPACQGAGRVIEDPCAPCHGSGRVRKEKTLAVNIPAGVEDGMRIRLSGEGEAGTQGGPAGDLYIFVTVRPHPLFSRDAMDIHCRVPLPMTTAALGGSVEVPSIDGSRAKVTIPQGTQSGHQFRLRGKGMSGLHGRGRGDLYIEISVETPVNLSKRQKEILEEFGGVSAAPGKPTNPQSEGFFSRVKELWEDLTD